MPATYDNSSVYNKFSSGCDCEDSSNCGCNKSSDCGCCPVGTVAIYDCHDKHLGCLTPADAEKYNNSQVEAPEGYVKVFHPTTGDYLGNMPPAQAIELLNFLNGDGVITVPDPIFNVVAPLALPSGYVELNYAASAGETADILIEIDRSNMDEIISATITGTVEDITYVPSGTLLPIASSESTLTVAFRWGNLVTAGTHFFNVTLTSSTVTRVIQFALILT